jgi:hypothetical protein
MPRGKRKARATSETSNSTDMQQIRPFVPKPFAGNTKNTCYMTSTIVKDIVKIARSKITLPDSDYHTMDITVLPETNEQVCTVTRTHQTLVYELVRSDIRNDMAWFRAPKNNYNMQDIEMSKIKTRTRQGIEITYPNVPPNTYIISTWQRDNYPDSFLTVHIHVATKLL